MWHFDERPIDTGVFDRMISRLAHRGPDGERRWVEGPTALACQFLHITPESVADRQPLAGSSGAVMVFDGRLDNRDELLVARGGLPSSSPDSAIALAAYEAHGESFVERLNGDFALAVFDPRADKMVLARDAIGVHPLHYCQLGNCLLFASEIKALLCHPEVATKFDEEYLANYLLLRNIGDLGQTFFRGVRSVPPAHTVVATRTGLRVRQYWDFNPGQTIHLGSDQDYVDAFRALFEQAIRRRLRSAYPVGVAVGGVDSSAVFCTAEVIHRRSPGIAPRLIGISHSANDGTSADEGKYLDDIERYYGVSIERVPDYPPGVFEGCEDEVWYSETPLVNPIWSGWRRIHTRLRELGVRVILTGDYADNWLSDEAYLIDLVHAFCWREVWRCIETTCRLPEAGSRSEMYQWYSWYFIRHHIEPVVPLLRRVMRPFRKGFRAPPYYTPAVIQNARHAPSARNLRGTAHFRSLYKTIRGGYNQLSFHWKNKVSSAYTAQFCEPFLDRDLLCFFLAVPGIKIRREGAWKGILLDGMAGILPEALRRRNTKADYTSVMTGGIRRDLEGIRNFLRGGVSAQLGYTREVEVGDFCRDLADGSSQPSVVGCRRVLDLLGLEAFLRVFGG